MSVNPATLRLYASIMERPRVGDVPAVHRLTHGMPFAPGDIAKAAAAALRFQADAIDKINANAVDLSAKMES